ncbi:MAG: hypothetical protein CMK46_07255 [Porticoccus sp.]|jgi:MerR family mercuric resistance operon transcriptional regulator|uniref:MerR family DNA-binding transcriptional regulator n=1 Tax=Porticoccus hydrocarbonoclasticus TaxID=1073414 RepID=UPI000C5CB28F|nr:MerR family DNA-binding transcriptional regulator [Porticoccus hydrocarbonoclasticus]MBG58071.1 hypothetical protein [Porticoccus sp.]|tara:strand:+ start:19432 stop:19629 length:198 start_codon:yes stop_codon:yes gene_type:complete
MNHAETKGLNISKLANAANINVETVRYYERRKLIEQPTKPEHGYRKYSQATLERILFFETVAKTV